MSNNVENLKKALKFAIKIIESYQLDIDNSDTDGICLEINLKQKGFCQGEIYLTAIEDIKRMAEENKEVKHNIDDLPDVEEPKLSENRLMKESRNPKTFV